MKKGKDISLFFRPVCLLRAISRAWRSREQPAEQQWKSQARWAWPAAGNQKQILRGSVKSITAHRQRRRDTPTEEPEEPKCRQSCNKARTVVRSRALSKLLLSCSQIIAAACAIGVVSYLTCDGSTDSLPVRGPSLWITL